MVAEATRTSGVDFYLMDELLTAEERSIRDFVLRDKEWQKHANRIN